MKVFVQQRDHPGCRGLDPGVLCLTDDHRGDHCVVEWKRRQKRHWEVSLAIVNIALQQRVVSHLHKTRGGFWVANEELVIRSDEQNGERGLAPIRPYAITNLVGKLESFSQSNAISWRDGGLLGLSERG